MDLFFGVLEVHNDFLCEKLMVIEPLAFRLDQHSGNEISAGEGPLTRCILPYNAACCGELQFVVEDGHGLIVRPSGNVSVELHL